jgi:hypothetical protein
MRDSPANTKDLLDSRSVVYYSLTQTIDVRAEVPLSLPVPITQHTLGPAFLQCLVIQSREFPSRGSGECFPRSAGLRIIEPQTYRTGTLGNVSRCSGG